MLESPTKSTGTLLDYFISKNKVNHRGKENLAEKVTTVVEPKKTTVSKYNRFGLSDAKICPFYKKVEGTTIVVDGFRFSKCANSTTFVLSHWHSDHYAGLTAGWNFGTIYTSEITSRLLKLNYPGLSKRVVAIPLNTRTEIKDDTGLISYVTMMDANHCPGILFNCGSMLVCYLGAVVLLFEIKGRKVFHCGDMRFTNSMKTWPGWSNLGYVDLCYLDTTYCDPKHIFPAQIEMINYTSLIVEEALRSQNKTLILVGTYYIGKEKVLVDIAKRCNCKIFAASHKLKVLKLLDLPNVWTSNVKETNVRVVSMGDINFRVWH